MSKKICIRANLILLIWFFFDMTGLRIGNFILTEMAWQEDGIFFIIYIACFLLFLFKDKFGKYVLSIWIFLWGITQFFSHWYYTIFGASQSKLNMYNNIYSETYHIVSRSETTIVPDLYHIILHILIVISFLCTINCLRRKK